MIWLPALEFVDLAQQILPSHRGSPLGKVRLATDFWPQGEGKKVPSWATARVSLGAGRLSLAIPMLGEAPAGWELALGARLQDCYLVFIHGSKAGSASSR